MVFTFFVVVAVASLQYLTTSAEDQVSLQADCVASRPPPVECQPPALNTTTTLAGSPTTQPPQTIPPGGVALWSTVPAKSGTTVSGVVSVRDQVTSAPLQERHRAGSRPVPRPASRSTPLRPRRTPTGQATVTWETTDCPPGTTSALIVIYEIESDPYVENMPPNRTVAL
ncbi:MAG: hypothetical protein R2699_17215 [Acidimicrobiales bacterium]